LFLMVALYYTASHGHAELRFAPSAKCMWTTFVENNGKPVIVFDGYTAGLSTKDVTHQRRTRGVVGTNVVFSEDTPFK